MENRKTVLVRYHFSSFNGACIYDLASGRKLTKLSLSLSLAQLSPSLFYYYFAFSYFSGCCGPENVRVVSGDSKNKRTMAEKVLTLNQKEIIGSYWLGTYFILNLGCKQTFVNTHMAQYRSRATKKFR